MSRLLRVELTRLRWRRAVLLLLASAVVVPLVMAAFIAVQKSPPSADGQVRAERAAAKQVARCVKRPNRYGVDKSGDVQAQCEDANPPEFFTDYDTLDLVYEREDGSGPGVAAVLGVLMFLLGTTFVGHDWNTGSMSNQLLFVPRRLQVWAAKAMAVVLAALVASVIGASLFWAVLWLRYTSGGVGAGDGVLLDCLQQGWRSAGVAAVAALGGYALTMLSRSTVFTLGVLFGISVAGGIFINAIVDDPGPWDPTINAAAVIKDGITYYVDIPESCYTADFTGEDTSGPCAQNRSRSLNQGLGYLGVLVVVVGGASAISFGRRDVP